jgi:hypothetical protein
MTLGNPGAYKSEFQLQPELIIWVNGGEEDHG